MSTPLSALLLTLGILVMVVGGWVLWGGRLSRARQARRGGPTGAAGNGRVPHHPPRSRVSEPTRVSTGVVLLLIGYHLIAWGFPPRWGSPVAMPPHLWYVVLGVGVVWIALSILVDQLDRDEHHHDDHP